jgi:hypothetical protein
LPTEPDRFNLQLLQVDAAKAGVELNCELLPVDAAGDTGVTLQ